MATANRPRTAKPAKAVRSRPSRRGRAVAPSKAESRQAATSAPVRPKDLVGVRELRQNLSVYLDRVKLGEALQVTEHGRVVAVLRPVPVDASRIDILIAQGKITPATRSIRDLPPPRKAPPGSRPMSEILDELREDRF